MSMIRAKPVSKMVRKKYIKKPFKEGDWIEDFNVGAVLTFEEIENMVGELIVIDYSTFAHPWFKVVRVVEIVPDGHFKRLVFSDGKKSRGMISSSFFEDDGAYRTYAFRLCRKGADRK